ncbi:Ancient ubiquitous protein 1 [Acipenser ruthenus]|uniref:Lipid droplet-regulating VLDL assembly factor AUP1 n=1 Tax=Acipenser ruthenus TaxID=7906 RepID=A0A444UMV1_ACIRT|nr:Ancient ubiquitous protein 1 [Acipenser ruthenus]
MSQAKTRRLPKDGFLLLLFLLYAPVGLCLLLLRLFIGVHVFLVSCALPDSLVRRFIVRVMWSVLGVFVKQNDPRLRDRNVKVYICNHVTQFDHNIINLLTSCNTNIEESSWILELLWTLFIPFTVYQVRWLPTVSRQDGNSSQEFGNEVQELLAMELGVVSTQITRADKVEHLKRKRHIAPRTVNSNQSPGARPRAISLGFMAGNSMVEDVRISGMVQQVKEVLPHVPLSVIKRDLVQTNCVDTTITNLLERAEEMNSNSSGVLSVAAIQTSSLNAVGDTASAPALKPNAKSFGKYPGDRHMSLQDRKEALYEYARRCSGMSEMGESPPLEALLAVRAGPGYSIVVTNRDREQEAVHACYWWLVHWGRGMDPGETATRVDKQRAAERAGGFRRK